VETSITTKGCFGIVNKSESVAILAIFKANRFTVSRTVKTIDNVPFVETRATAFRYVYLLNAEQYGVLHNVSSREGIEQFRALGQLFPILETTSDAPTSFLRQPWSCVVHPSDPDWKEMIRTIHSFGADISFLQPCADVPQLCF